MEVYQIVFYSDKRIKTNIEDVPDHLALETVRNIPCRYYNYRDNEKFNNRYKTIGFIAQEVAEVFPEAILKEKGIIPNIGIFLTNEHNTNLFSWEHDVSNNKWKLTIPTINDLIIDNSDNVYEKCKVKFVVTAQNEDDYKKEMNDASGDLIKIGEIKEKYKKEEKEIILEIEDDLQSFIFDKKWDNVFLYGTEVKDLLTVDKQKIFALHHSAIQEIDRKVIALENENAELDNKTQEVDNKIKEIKNTEDILLKSNKYEKNNTENIIGNISFVNGYTTVNDKKIYNKNISDKLYFNPETSKLYCSNIENTFYGDGSNLQGIAKLSQIEHLIEDNKRLIQDNENNKELINFWTKQAMNLNNKLTTVETKLANVENELKLIKENLGL